MFNYFLKNNVLKNNKMINTIIRLNTTYIMNNSTIIDNATNMVNFNYNKFNDVGYIYCISNKSMPGIIKIGMTKRNPLIRLKESNLTDTWRPPTPYNIDFYIKVNNPKKIEKEIHNILDQHNRKIHKKREFFKLELFEAKYIFNKYNIIVDVI